MRGRPQCQSKGQCDKLKQNEEKWETDRCYPVALRREEAAQTGMQVASHSRKNRGSGFSPRTSKKQLVRLIWTYDL